MRILWRHDDPFQSASISEIKEIDINPIWTPGNPIPDTIFLEFDGETVAEYPMDGTKETFESALSRYNQCIYVLFKDGCIELKDFGAEIL